MVNTLFHARHPTPRKNKKLRLKLKKLGRKVTIRQHGLCGSSLRPLATDYGRQALWLLVAASAEVAKAHPNPAMLRR